MGSKKDYMVLYIWTILLCFLFLTLAFCDKAHATEWYFSESEAQNLCVTLEKCDNYKEQVQTCLSVVNELEQMDVLLKKNFKFATDNYEIEKEANKLLKERIVLMDKQCDKRVEDAKPSLWHQLGVFTEGVVTGIVITIAGALLL